MARNDRVLPYFGTIHDGGIDADQTPIADFTTVQSRVVRNRAVLPNNRGRGDPHMNHHEVLNVGPRANPDLIGLGAGDNIGPDGGTGTHIDLAV